MAFKVTTKTITVHPEHWKKFAKVAADQGQNASSLLRLLVTKELQRVAREHVAKDSQGE